MSDEQWLIGVGIISPLSDIIHKPAFREETEELSSPITRTCRAGKQGEYASIAQWAILRGPSGPRAEQRSQHPTVMLSARNFEATSALNVPNIPTPSHSAKLRVSHKGPMESRPWLILAVGRGKGDLLVLVFSPRYSLR